MQSIGNLMANDQGLCFMRNNIPSVNNQVNANIYFPGHGFVHRLNIYFLVYLFEQMREHINPAFF